MNSTLTYQQVDISLVASETKNRMEYLEPYGFTSTAHAGAEWVALFLGDDRSHGVVISIADRRYRIKRLKSGEVAICTDEGNSIMLKRGRLIEATTDTFNRAGHTTSRNAGKDHGGTIHRFTGRNIGQNRLIEHHASAVQYLRSQRL
ncbi:phage baseplate assembly protein domain-containing protein [Arsenophonus endosymbiont of Aleurodicus floccissimus]|uniref:phage baseplate assembly protein domain-containing protein n=1 Tax=Arsenophonus endosymbiont of Aleurodicus floccissimus TaxID=2152761 RepID=UPI003F6E57CC